jgi:hypothetical protein
MQSFFIPVNRVSRTTREDGSARKLVRGVERAGECRDFSRIVLDKFLFKLALLGICGMPEEGALPLTCDFSFRFAGPPNFWDAAQPLEFSDAPARLRIFAARLGRPLRCGKGRERLKAAIGDGLLNTFGLHPGRLAEGKSRIQVITINWKNRKHSRIHNAIYKVWVQFCGMRGRIQEQIQLASDGVRNILESRIFTLS